MAIDEQKVEEAVGKVFGELGVAITGPLIVLGDRLGLWAAMAGAGPVMATPNSPKTLPTASSTFCSSIAIGVSFHRFARSSRWREIAPHDCEMSHRTVSAGR